MSLLFLGCLVAFALILRGKRVPAIGVVFVVLFVLAAILKWEATTPLKLNF